MDVIFFVLNDIYAGESYTHKCLYLAALHQAQQQAAQQQQAAAVAQQNQLNQAAAAAQQQAQQQLQQHTPNSSNNKQGNSQSYLSARNKTVSLHFYVHNFNNSIILRSLSSIDCSRFLPVFHSKKNP